MATGMAQPLAYKKGAYENLEVYNLAYVLSLEVHKASMDFLKIEQYNGIADQLRRSSKSICANLAEGHAKQLRSRVEFKRFVWIALGSANESRMWVRYAFDLGYINNNTFVDWTKQYDRIAAMLFGLAGSK